MTTPTIGRVVHYFPSSEDLAQGNGMVRHGNQPFCANVCYVHDEHLINVVVIDHAGKAWVRTSVPINVDALQVPRADWPPRVDQKPETPLETRLIEGETARKCRFF